MAIIKTALAFIVTLLIAVPALAHPIDDYLVMVDKAIAQPRQANYIALRKAYYAIVVAPNDARSNKMADDIDAAKKGFDAARAKHNLDLAERYLRTYLRLTYGTVLNQSAAAVFYEKDLNNPTRAAEHRYIADQMLLAITKIGDGKSASSAYQATSEREENLVMERLRLQPRGQSLVTEKGRQYNVIRAVPAKEANGPEVSVYFDVSSFF